MLPVFRSSPPVILYYPVYYHGFRQSAGMVIYPVRASVRVRSRTGKDDKYGAQTHCEAQSPESGILLRYLCRLSMILVAVGARIPYFSATKSPAPPWI